MKEESLEHKYSTVTELPGSKVTQEQLIRIYQRYHFALQFCQKREVLEVACGGGIGLGCLAKNAKRVVGGDIDNTILDCTKEHYADRNKIELREFDAHQLPFENNSFDVVILYEALYYLSNPVKFINEARRVLRKNGILLICTANKELPDFNPSPFSHKYFSASELYTLMSRQFSRVKLYGAFPVSTKGIKKRTISFIKKAVVALHIMPKSMKGKKLLKRIFFGKLITLPPEIEGGQADYIPPIDIPPKSPCLDYKVLFASASDF